MCRCRPKGSKLTTRLSSSAYSETSDCSSSEDEDVRDDMLYIPVDSDDEIRVRSAHSDSSSYSTSDDSSSVTGSQSPSDTCTVQDDEKPA